MQSIKGKVGVHSFAFGDVIGQGAFSKVLMARMKGTSDYYAVKVLSKAFIKKEGKEEAVMAEREALVKTNHPFIIKLHYSFQDSQCLYFVISLCRGGSFWDLIKALRLPGRGCDITLVHFYMAEIISAVDYLHNVAHLIHRDLKPENILITDSGHIMLSDFGAITTSNNDYTKRRNTMCGTILYLAPESLHGGVITSAVDIWSIGCILYLLYTGCFLFEGEDELNVIDSIEHFCVDMLEFPDYIPIEAVDLIKRMLQYDPAKRATAAEIKKHPFFKNIDFDTLHSQKPPYIPPFVPLPVILDDELETELNALRGSIDESYRTAQEEKKEAITKLLQEGESCLLSSTVIHRSSVASKKRLLVLTSMRRLLILDSQATVIKTELEPSQLAKVFINPHGFHLAVNYPSKKVYKFETPNKDQSVWCNCVEHLIKQQTGFI
ncbi:hypothetical protein WA171_006702 [Blastocystis sp. BT1]